MNLRRAKEVSEIWAVLDDELFRRISPDGVEPDNVADGLSRMVNDPIHYFFMIEVDSQDIGWWWLHADNGSHTALSIHCNILKQHREHGLEASDLILKWFYNAAPTKYQKLIAEIPVIYPEVYHHTKKYGFRDEGINRKSIRKDGLIVDQYRLGLTREEASPWSLRGLNE